MNYFSQFNAWKCIVHLKLFYKYKYFCQEMWILWDQSGNLLCQQIFWIVLNATNSAWRTGVIFHQRHAENVPNTTEITQDDFLSKSLSLLAVAPLNFPKPPSFPTKATIWLFVKNLSRTGINNLFSCISHTSRKFCHRLFGINNHTLISWHVLLKEGNIPLTKSSLDITIKSPKLITFQTFLRK